ncbi:MAG TPA: ATP-binding protein [Ramlibacter sp.]|uniref:ATP-binding protein n=1 Tax=Ramlibacter sp. TaxID=1917967 RepID=UPI002C8B4FB1|nr:ATP-binding protein [Ramlibacter sp.]HVZ46211.1 ATP-binding protein [Ramlibacter sp.]
MKPGYSIRARLVLGAALVLLAFLAGAGAAVKRAHAQSVLSERYAQLQSTVYLLLSHAELDDAGRLVMPMTLAEPRLSVPQSGLYAGIYNVNREEQWRSLSTLGVSPPFRLRGLAPGEWRTEVLEGGGRPYIAVSYAVNWAVAGKQAPLVLSVVEDQADFNHELAVFARTLWAWLGGAAVLLLVAQSLLLAWAMRPLRQVIREVRRIEGGEQARIEGRYPMELSGLTDNLNTLIQQERDRQVRYKEALSFLAHSLKTPLAVLRNALHEPAGLPQAVREQVARMDDIVGHQLGRAAASGAARFAPPVKIAPVLQRVREALVKVYSDKGIEIEVDCSPELAWRIDEGDLFEILGNLMDNAAKWASRRVIARAARDARGLHIAIEDDGRGFAAETEALLRLHVRGDERVPGHGVGLANVNDIVRSHAGELQLLRSELGGARVLVSLPDGT